MSNKFDLDEDSRAVIRAEYIIWDGWRNRDLDAITAHTATDYVAIDPEGYFDWASVVEYVPKTTLVEYTIDGMLARQISPEVITLAFTVIAQLGGGSSYRTIRLSVVSIWVRRNNRWLSVLRHEMPLPTNQVTDDSNNSYV
jgi:hypothetical protein